MRKKINIPRRLLALLENHIEGINGAKRFFGKRKPHDLFNPKARKLRPYTAKTPFEFEWADCFDVAHYGLPSRIGTTRKRKATRRLFKKAFRAMGKREIASLIYE